MRLITLVLLFVTVMLVPALPKTGKEDPDFQVLTIPTEIGGLLNSSTTVKMAVIVQSHCEDFGENLFNEDYYSTREEKFLLSLYADNPFFILVERDKLDKILEEYKLTYTGIIEKGSLESGRILGVKFILYVNVYPSYLIEKFINIEEGRIIAVYMEDI